MNTNAILLNSSELSRKKMSSTDTKDSLDYISKLKKKIEEDKQSSEKETPAEAARRLLIDMGTVRNMRKNYDLQPTLNVHILNEKGRAQKIKLKSFIDHNHDQTTRQNNHDNNYYNSNHSNNVSYQQFSWSKFVKSDQLMTTSTEGFS